MKVKNLPVVPQYDVLGRFISCAASFEFFINASIEMVASSDRIIDHMQRQPLDVRIEFLKQSAFIAKCAYDKFLNKDVALGLEDSCNNICNKLDEVNIFYANKVKPCRDLIAHSPIVKGPRVKIVSSRRYKAGGRNSLNIAELEQIIADSEIMLKGLNSIVGLTQSFFGMLLGKREIERELT
jgi:hypothetical protein